MNKSDIRRLIRQRRNSLTRPQRRAAATQLLHTLRASRHFQYSRRIALYLTNDAEIDTSLLIRDLQRRGRDIFLPVLHPLRKGHLSFLPYARSTPMTRNRFGIAEPDFRRSKATPARFISLICMPLVAFDDKGNRLGMGGGFYDRTLMFMHRAGQKPALTGLAYELQKMDELPVESWDIAPDAVATERHYYRFSKY